MTPDPVRRIANRRAMIATLRTAADTAERTAAEMRERADRLEADTDRLEQEAR